MPPPRRIVAFLGAIAEVFASSGNFSRSCQDVGLLPGATGRNATLHAECRGLGPALLHSSTLDLNLCVGLDQTKGVLAWSV